MFEYDKIVKKLEKFDELPEKKQKKTLNRVFCDESFREWFYGVGDNKDSQPMNNTMIQKLFNLLARPVVVKVLIDFINSQDSETFDRTSCAIAFLVIDNGIDALNKANGDVSEESKNGSLSSKELRTYKERSERYTEYMGDLLNAIKEKSGREVKEICKKCNLPKTLVYTTYFIVPGRKYVPKYKVSMYMNQILRETYKYVGSNGLENIEMIRWGSLFGPYFGSDMTTSAAVSILLEGVKRIEAYQSTEYFDDVKSIWNSLTNFALSELDNAPENVRRQMVELYIKKIDRLYRNGNGPRLRVNVLQLPSEFNNLIGTISRYSDRIESIVKTGLKPVADFKQKYVDEPRRKRDIDNAIKDIAEKTRDSSDESKKDDDIDFSWMKTPNLSTEDEEESETLLKGVKNEKLMKPIEDDYFSEEEDEDEKATPPAYFEEDD
jgi:hypothetical protein